MNSRKVPNSQTIVALLVAVLAFLIWSPVLHGCSGTSHDDAANEAQDRYPLSDQSVGELSRFAIAHSAIAGEQAANSRQLKHFRDAFRRIRSAYVYPLNDQQLIDAAIEGMRKTAAGSEPVTSTVLINSALDAMTASLDPHSVYLDPQELKEAELATTGEFGGLGIQVTRDDKSIRVISPIEDTPAERAGLKSGDLITHVDGLPVADMTLSQAVRKMRGEPGTSVRLGVKRDGKGAFEVSITRAIIAVRPIRWRVEDDIAYIRVANFNEKTSAALQDAMEKIDEQSGSSIHGIVLDLRNNPGGLFNQSLRVADAFLDDGVIVGLRGRDSTNSREFLARSGDIAEGRPMVVLINGGSASASEIVAAALQDHGRATVMGTRSFGKGSVQTVMRLPVEGALKLTTSLYYAPSGQLIQSQGVEPDIVLEGETTRQTAREADLPGALPAAKTFQPRSKAKVNVRTCPSHGSDAKDQELSCAAAFLEAGSLDRFVRTLAAGPTG